MSDDLDPCPYCGRDEFGNAGARAQHVRACEEEAEKYQQADESEGEAQEVQTIQPARSAQEQQNNLPAARDGTDGVGETLGLSVAGALDDDAPVEKRTEGVKKVANLAGGLLSGFMHHREQKQERQEEQAKRSNLEPVEDKPQCECGAVFSRIPENADRVRCPECGREYRVQ